MIEQVLTIILYLIGVMVGIPILVYLCTKMATVGYYRGKLLFFDKRNSTTKQEEMSNGQSS